MGREIKGRSPLNRRRQIDGAREGYRRSDALEERSELMAAWANYCEPKAGANVVEIKRGRKI